MPPSAVIVTKDEDFVVLRTLEPDGPAVMWLRMGVRKRCKVIVPLF